MSDSRYDKYSYSGRAKIRASEALEKLQREMWALGGPGWDNPNKAILNRISKARDHEQHRRARNEENVMNYPHDEEHRKQAFNNVLNQHKNEIAQMAFEDRDVGNNHPEEQLTIPEPLAVTDTDLHASQPRKRARVIRRFTPYADPIHEMRYRRLPIELQRDEVNSFLRPGLGRMTHIESIDAHLRGNSSRRNHNADIKNIRRVYRGTPLSTSGQLHEFKTVMHQHKKRSGNFDGFYKSLKGGNYKQKGNSYFQINPIFYQPFRDPKNIPARHRHR